MKSEIHRRGFMSIRHLMAEAGYVDHDLFYDELGKPHLKNGSNISITHSFNFTAIILSDRKVGIDIEKRRDKILKIANKFIRLYIIGGRGKRNSEKKSLRGTAEIFV